MVDQLIDGVLKFKESVVPEHQELFDDLANSQSPQVLFITCSDSRIDPNMVTQSKPGDLFICRNAGNIVPPHSIDTGGMTASIEYAVAVLGVKHIVVCGHSDCGAMKGALDVDNLKGLPHVKEWLSYARSAVAVVDAMGVSDDERLQRVTEQNVLQQLIHLRSHPAVAAKLAMGELTLHGWIYDIKSGGICGCNKHEEGFSPITKDYEPRI